MSGQQTPPSISEIDASWLTTQLRNAGHDATVTAVEKTQIGTGQMARCFRLGIEVETNDPTVPKSLIVKVTSDDELSKEAGSSQPAYRKEVEFYQKFYKYLGITVPKCYFAGISDDNINFAILLEDMSPAEQGNQIEGCGPELTKKAVMELVGLHAPTWANPGLLIDGDEMRPLSVPISYIQQAYVGCAEGFIERHGHILADDQKDIIRQLAQYDEPLFKFDPDNYSLIHMDYRLDNFLIGPEDNDPTLTIVDWQTYEVGNPLWDVAMCIGSSMDAETRRGVEEDIVRAYHEGLVAAGVKGFDWDDCWLAYRKGSFYGFIMSVSASMMVKRTERGDKMFQTVADRVTRHAIDLKAYELFR